MKGTLLALAVLPGKFAVCRLAPQAPLPRWAKGRFISITHTAEELAIVCEQRRVPPAIICEKEWRCLKVQGPLELALTGILAALAAPLAQAGICLFAISTYDTDYVLVQDKDLAKAVRVLSRAGHHVRRGKA